MEKNSLNGSRRVVEESCDGLFWATSPEEAARHMDQLLPRLKGEGGRKLARRLVRNAQDIVGPLLISALLQRRGSSGGRYVVLDRAQNCGFFAAAALVLGMEQGRSVSVPAVRRQLAFAADYLGRLETVPGPPLSAEEIEDVLARDLCRKALEIVGDPRPLLIFLLRARDREFNSCYVPGIHAVLLTEVRAGEAYDPRYIFLHEIGHSLHVTLTKDMRQIPPSFFPVFHITFGTDPARVEDEVWPEIFADSFTIAVSHGTELADTNPFCGPFLEFSKAGLAKYFELLLEAATADKARVLAEPWDFVWDERRRAAFCSAVEAAGGGSVLERYRVRW